MQSPRWRTPKLGSYSDQRFFDFFAFFGILVVFARPATGVLHPMVEVVFGHGDFSPGSSQVQWDGGGWPPTSASTEHRIWRSSQGGLDARRHTRAKSPLGSLGLWQDLRRRISQEYRSPGSRSPLESPAAIRGNALLIVSVGHRPGEGCEGTRHWSRRLPWLLDGTPFGVPRGRSPRHRPPSGGRRDSAGRAGRASRIP
jgi:hypothetical protein